MKIGVLRNFTKFTGKHLYQSLFFNIKKETLAQAFSSEFCKILKNTSGQLLLKLSFLVLMSTFSKCPFLIYFDILIVSTYFTL